MEAALTRLIQHMRVDISRQGLCFVHLCGGTLFQLSNVPVVLCLTSAFFSIKGTQKRAGKEVRQRTSTYKAQRTFFRKDTHAMWHCHAVDLMESGAFNCRSIAALDEFAAAPVTLERTYSRHTGRCLE
jgi:hypothetical protein